MNFFTRWFSKKRTEKAASKPVVGDCPHCGTLASDEPHCHYCNTDDSIGSGRLIVKRCPSCGHNHWFHSKFCGERLSLLQPHCEGRYVADRSGHTRSLSDPTKCVLCSLKASEWDKWYCSRGNKRFFEKALASTEAPNAYAPTGTVPDAERE